MCVAFSLSSWQSAHHLDPWKHLFCKLSEVGALFSNMHHIKTLVLGVLLIFHRAFYHHLTSCWLPTSMSLMHYAFGVYLPLESESQIRMSSLSLSWIWAWAKFAIYKPTSLLGGSGRSKTFTEIQFWEQPLAWNGAAIRERNITSLSWSNFNSFQLFITT